MLLVIKLLIELHMVGLGTFSYMCKIYLTLDLNSSSMITTSSLVALKLLISTLATRKASQIWEVVEKRNATIVMLCRLVLQHLWFCHWLFTTIIFRWCKVQRWARITVRGYRFKPTRWWGRWWGFSYRCPIN